MGALALLLALGYLSAAADPCNSPEGHRGACSRAVYGPASTESRPLDQYPRAEFGVLQLHRADPALPGVPLFPLAGDPLGWVACDLAEGGCL